MTVARCMCNRISRYATLNSKWNDFFSHSNWTAAKFVRRLFVHVNATTFIDANCTRQCFWVDFLLLLLPLSLLLFFAIISSWPNIYCIHSYVNNVQCAFKIMTPNNERLSSTCSDMCMWKASHQRLYEFSKIKMREKATLEMWSRKRRSYLFRWKKLKIPFLVVMSFYPLMRLAHRIENWTLKTSADFYFHEFTVTFFRPENDGSIELFCIRMQKINHFRWCRYEFLSVKVDISWDSLHSIPIYILYFPAFVFIYSIFRVFI